MAVRRLVCPECQTPVLPSAVNQYSLTSCNGCSSRLEVEVFPALFRQRVPGQAAESLIVEGESSCFFHANKKAVLPCQSCGRFICALCDCELNREHFCPACLEAGKTRGKIKNLQNERPLYDSIALMLATLPAATLLFWFLTALTAPAAVVISIVYWNAPRSIIHRTKARYILAIIFGTLQIAGWIIMILRVVANYHG